MSSESSKAYRDYKLIEGINLLVNMVERSREDKESLKKINEGYFDFEITFANKIELIYATGTDKLRCNYMVSCMNKLRRYMKSEFPYHLGLIRMLVDDFDDSVGMAIMGDIHLWKQAQLEAIQAAFRSARVAKATPYFEPKQLEEREQKQLEDNRKGRHAI